METYLVSGKRFADPSLTTGVTAPEKTRFSFGFIKDAK